MTPASPGPALDERPDGRLVEFIRTEEGAPIAVVIADPALARYRGLFDAAVQTSGLALQNAELQARAAREKLEQVRASRARIVEAGLAERRRLERDLHDGVQQHLLGLAAQLSVAMRQSDDATAHETLARVRRGSGRCWPSSGTSRTASTRRCCRTAGWPRRSATWRRGCRCRSG